MQRTAWIAFLACAGVACQPASPPPEVSAANLDVCEELARVFFLIATHRERGKSRESQEEMVRQSVNTPFTTDPERTRDDLLHVVGLVYRSPEIGPRELEAKVLADCHVNERGQAVLRTLWPTR